MTNNEKPENDGKSINRLLDAEKWEEARAYILRLLEEQPENHWLMTRLSVTYYEQFRYDKALEISEKALVMTPKCPLVLWDCAGSLDMLERYDEAIPVYKWLVTRGVKRLAYGECGEGIRWARSLVNDCRYRLASIYAKKGEYTKSKTYLKRYIRERDPNTPSIYNLREAKKFLASVLIEMRK